MAGLRIDVDAEALTAVVRDPRHPKIEAEFSYVVPHLGRLALVAVSVRPRSGLRDYDQKLLTITDVRDLPMSTWEQAARGETGAKVLEAIAVAASADSGAYPVGWLTPAERKRVGHVNVREAIGRVQPELLEAERARPNDGRVQRSMRAAERLAQVAALYRYYVRAGAPNPSEAIAETFGVNASTARAWVHRARKAGYLGPATRSAPGEEPLVKRSRKTTRRKR